MNYVRTVAWLLFAVVATYTASEWAVSHKATAGAVAALPKDVQGRQESKEIASQDTLLKDLMALEVNYKAQIRHLNERMANVGQQIDMVQSRGVELDRLNREQAQRMSTHQGVVLEAKRVLGVQHAEIVER